MSFGKKQKINRNIDFAVMAMAEKVRFGDPSITEYEMEAMMNDHEDFVTGFDVEMFVYSLKYQDLVVLLFKSLNVSMVDIAGILNCSKSEISKSSNRLKLKAKNIV